MPKMTGEFYTLKDVVRPGLLAATSLLLLKVLYDRKSNLAPYRIPPSPGLAMPVLGHMYLMKANPRQQFLKWGKRLGPVFSLYMGSNLVIVLNGFDVLKEALVKQADKFSNRPHTYISSQLCKNSGFVTAGGGWQTQRKVSVEIFRKLGQGTGEFEKRINQEINELLPLLHACEDLPIDPKEYLTAHVSNIVYSILFGADFRFDDPKTEECVQLMAEQAVLLEGMIALDFLPFLRYLPGDIFGLKKTLTVNEYIETNLIKRQITSLYDQESTEEPREFISFYLREIMSRRMKDGNNSDINEDNMVTVVLNLLIASIDTTSISLTWAVLFLLHHPEVQDKCYSEIEQNIGENQRPEFKDLAQLPYTEAMILEVLRRASISPFAIHHTVSEDVILRDYLIPKDTIILPSLDSVLLSEEIWGDPYNFRPERFLQDDGINMKEYVVPFGMGRRSCFGEKMGKMMLMLFLTSIIQVFHIRSPQNTPLPSLQDKFGLNCQPEPFQVCFIPR